MHFRPTGNANAHSTKTVASLQHSETKACIPNGTAQMHTCRSMPNGNAKMHTAPQQLRLAAFCKKKACIPNGHAQCTNGNAKCTECQTLANRMEKCILNENVKCTCLIYAFNSTSDFSLLRSNEMDSEHARTQSWAHITNQRKIMDTHHKPTSTWAHITKQRMDTCIERTLSLLIKIYSI